jgi:chemotaxis methyl-accepting protein methylase
MPNVTFANLRVPEQWPLAQKFDLILLSEVLYFLNQADIERVAAHAMASLSPGGIVLLVNYTGQIEEPLSGHQAAEIFISATQSTLRLSLHEHHEKFRIDRLDLERESA